MNWIPGALLWSALSFAQEGAPLSALEEGRARMLAKEYPAARAAFDRCIREGGPDVVNCQWERGWEEWIRGDWKGVVADWEAVQKVDPTRKDLEKYLVQARDNLALAKLLAEARSSAPPTFKSKVPSGATLRLRAVGDMMISTDFPEGVMNPEIDQTFGGVSDWLRDADITFGNLEGPLCDTGISDKCKPEAPEGSCYAFRTPTRYAPLYKAAGFDVVSTANNHAEDFGIDCRIATEKALDAQGIAHSGRPGDIARMEINGFKVALIGFHTNRNSHYVNDHAQAAELVKAMARESDLVIVSFHGGAEGGKALHVPMGGEVFYGEDRGDLRKFARVVIDAGADLVIGHGPHVLRGMEVYKDRLIAYSLGNFATYGRFSLKGYSGVGAVLDVTLAKDGRFAAGKVLPTRQIGDGVPVKDPEATAVDLIRTLSAEDFGATAVQVAQDGSLQAP